MTQQRSNDEIRADIAAMDASAMWSDRYHDALIRVLRDVEPLLARAERAEAQVRAVREQAESWRNNNPEASAYANAVENCGDALVDLLVEAGLSLQEEQE